MCKDKNITGLNNIIGSKTMFTYEDLVNGCDKANVRSLTPCIKQKVYAVIVTLSGKEYYGSNWMENKGIVECLRMARGIEDYGPCKSECRQIAHAEVSAINVCIEAGDTPVGATLYLGGHKHCCDGCQDSIQKAGVSKAIVIENGKAYSF